MIETVLDFLEPFVLYIKDYFILFFSFFKVALFNFGGGNAMYTLMESEVVNHGWLTVEQFSNIFAIAQMTPGPVAINSATYVGYTQYNILGSALATLAIPIPSFIIVVLISPYILKFKEHSLYKMIFYGLKAVVVGLVINAAFKVAFTSLINVDQLNTTLDKFTVNFTLSFNLGSIAIFILSYILAKKYKMNPIFVIIIAAILGIIVFSF